MGLQETITSELTKQLKNETNEKIIEKKVDEALTEYLESDKFEQTLKEIINGEDFNSKVSKKVSTALNRGLSNSLRVDRVDDDNEIDYMPVGDTAKKTFSCMGRYLEDNQDMIRTTVKEKMEDGRLNKKIDTLLNKFLSSSGCQTQINKHFKDIFESVSDDFIKNTDKIKQFKERISEKIETQLNRVERSAKITFKK